MDKKDYQNLAKAVRNGMNIQEALEIVNNEPKSPDKAAFWNELNNPRTSLSIFKETKLKIKALKRNDETYDDVLMRMVNYYSPNEPLIDQIKSLLNSEEPEPLLKARKLLGIND